MFMPNQIGLLSTAGARDIHGRATFSAAIPCPFAVINTEQDKLKTSVRADSSASRGSADDISSKHAKILVANSITIKIGDRFQFDGVDYRVAASHTRRSVFGNIDHFEIGLEMFPL